MNRTSDARWVRLRNAKVIYLFILINGLFFDDYLVIQTDKPIRESNRVYRLDKYEGFSTFPTSMCNIASLMTNEPHSYVIYLFSYRNKLFCSAKLRRLLIDRCAPVFGKLCQSDMNRIRDELKSLTTIEQKRAIVKTLIAVDYVLIETVTDAGE